MSTFSRRVFSTIVLASAVAASAWAGDASPRPEAASGTIKWNPGHYIKFAADSTDEEIDARLSEVKDLPFVKGVVVRNYWKQLEPVKDNYDFKRVDRHLKLAAAKGKRFFLLLSTKGFSAGSAAPDYLRVPFYDGGIYEIRGAKGLSGENIALWNMNVRYRLVLLIKALARRYNGHPNFEGIILNETAFGQPIDEISETITDEMRNTFYANLIHVDNVARGAFNKTVVIQYINFPRTQTPAIVENMLKKGIGFGAPDAFLEDDDHEKFVYPYNDMAQDRVPIGMQIESDTLLRRCFACETDPPPVKELYTFARDRLHSNYIFWDYFQRDYYRGWDKILALFKSPDFPQTPSGGLATTCPSQYASCITK